MELLSLCAPKFTDFLAFKLCSSLYTCALPVRHDLASIQPQHIAPLRSGGEDRRRWPVAKHAHSQRNKPFDGMFEWLNLLVCCTSFVSFMAGKV